MILNKPKRFTKKMMTLFLASILFLFSIATYASIGESYALISLGENSAKGSEIYTPQHASTGKLEVESHGPNSYVQGYAKRSRFLFPDATSASGIAYVGNPYHESFSVDSGESYYASANTQANSTNVRGFARLIID